MNEGSVYEEKAKAIYFPPSPDENGGVIKAGDGVELIFTNFYHGSYDEDWILEMRDGKEVARHNARFLESIVWAEEANE